MMAAVDAPSSGAAVSTEGLRKRLGDTWAVDGLDITVPRGSIYGFLGPNGSGKSTTIRLLLGLLTPTSGEVLVLGRPVPSMAADVLPKVGAVIEGPAFYPYQSGRQNLRRRDALSPRPAGSPSRSRRVEEALDQVGLRAVADRPYRTYSLGMRQRLGLAAALLRPRELLLLDEPTNGLDPQGTRHVRDVIREVAAAGTTIVMSTHLLSEVEQLCTDAAVFRAGRVAAQGSLESLRPAGTGVLRVESRDPARAMSVLRTLPGVEDVTGVGEVVTASLSESSPEECFTALAAQSVPVRSFTTQVPTLEDAFIALTEQGFEVGR